MGLRSAALPPRICPTGIDPATLVDGTPEPMLLPGEADDHLASRPGESHPQALLEPCVNLSIHTAPDAQPPTNGLAMPQSSSRYRLAPSLG